jgi:hypothetical protein
MSWRPRFGYRQGAIGGHTTTTTVSIATVRRSEGVMSFSMQLCSAAATVAISIGLPTIGSSGDGWPDGPNKQWLENLQRPDNHLHPYRQSDPKSLSCCDVGDNVQTKFKVENIGGQYPEDIWYAWLDDTWTKIPSEKIVSDFSPNGQAYLFIMAGTIQMLRTA